MSDRFMSHAEETLDDAASRIEAEAEKLVDAMVLLAEEARSARLAARRRHGLGPADTETATGNPVALPGLSEAAAVLDYKRAVLKVVEWLNDYGRVATSAWTAQFRDTWTPVIGEDLFDALVVLRDSGD